MSSEPHEIVIIKRHGGGHEDEHHGGVWKIAFADFMTAMMAFFLVMWLISANDKTKAVIARYFNPVQLVDSTPQPRGLEDPKPGSASVMPKSSAPAPDPTDKTEKPDVKPGEGKAVAAETKPAEEKKDEKKEEAKPAKHNESDLMKDPYAVLAEIASKDQTQPPREDSKADSEGKRGGQGAVGIKGGAAYRDPFEPMPLPQGIPAEALSPTAGEATSAPSGELKSGEAKAGDAKGGEARQGDLKAGEAKSGDLKPGQAAAGDAKAPGAAADTPLTPSDKPATLAARIEAAERQTAPGAPAGALPQVEVKHTSEGTVIDLTDGANFSMFASASAEPSPRMVRLMEKVGRLLKAEKGRIVIRGFTDNRPFRSDTYDNWRLSAARAHMAHYMLVRGGLDEQRFDAIEGYGDRRPKNPKDPGGAENRRIEILLRDGTP